MYTEQNSRRLVSHENLWLFWMFLSGTLCQRAQTLFPVRRLRVPRQFWDLKMSFSYTRILCLANKHNFFYKNAHLQLSGNRFSFPTSPYNFRHHNRWNTSRNSTCDPNVIVFASMNAPDSFRVTPQPFDLLWQQVISHVVYNPAYLTRGLACLYRPPLVSF